MATQACPRCAQYGLHFNSEEWVCMICGATPYLSGGVFRYAKRTNEGDDFNTIMGKVRAENWRFWGK